MNYRSYLAQDVRHLEVKFKDGTKTNLKRSSNNKIVVMKVIPRAKNPFVVSVYENYSNGITAAELAEKCGYECFRTFQRHFKKHFGDTTYSWIFKTKMEDVSSLVLNTDLQMSEIAKKFKFKSPAHLTNAYKRQFGVCPQKHREQEGLS